MSSETASAEAALASFKSTITTKLQGVEEKKSAAQKTRQDYMRLRDNILARIQEVDTEIAGYDKQIESGNKAIRDLEEIYKREEELRQEEANRRTENGEEEEESDPFMTEDGLPMMEIYEELDDDGNVICGYSI